MIKGRCATCNHWKRFESRSDIAHHGQHAGKCNSEKFVYEGRVPTDGLTYWDAEGYSAGFETGEDFGCVHWAAKEDKCAE